MVSQEIIRSTITTYFAANTALDVEGFVNAFAPAASVYNAAEISPLIGLDAVRQVAEQSLVPFQELHARIERVFIIEDGAAVFYTADMTAKNGRKAQVEGIDVFEVNSDGKIQSIRYYFDQALMLALLS
jgi:steroid delta-isomerase